MHAAAAKLGYVPNAAARSLRAQRTHILGLLLDDLADPVHGQLAAGFEESAAGQGYAVFIMTGLHDPERERRALTGVRRASCRRHRAGILRQRPSRRAAPTCPSERVVFVQPDYPALAAGAEPPDRGVLRSDDDAGVTATVRHLPERGYRRLTYVGASGGPPIAAPACGRDRALEGLGDRTASHL